jgi:chromate transporter
MSPQVGTRARTIDVAKVFLKLGATAFGGPAAHVSLFHDETVERRRWLDGQHFLDLLGATNLIPGPNSTEMAIHIGFIRAGWPGLILAGLCFMLPAMLLVLLLSWLYVRFGSTYELDRFLYGIKPVVIGIIAKALFLLGKRALKGPLAAGCGLAVLVLYFLGLNPIVLLVFGGIGYLIAERLFPVRSALGLGFVPFAWFLMPAQALQSFSLPLLFLIFLKIGAVLYGSGYVLLAFLRSDLVVHLGWLTDQQLIDAIAIGQVTPGPLFTTSAFVGFLLGGLPGALLATFGFLLPSFLFVAISNPIIPRIRKSHTAGVLLDGVNICALALMAGVTWQLGRAAVIDVGTALLAAASVVVLFRTRVQPLWIILGGAGIGVLRHLLL